MHAPPASPAEGEVYDFGVVPIGTLVHHVFTITNTGDQPLTMKLDRKECGCTTAMIPGGRIEAGGSGWVEVSLDTSNAPGRSSRSVSLVTSSPQRPKLKLVLQGTVVPDVSASPERVFFGRVSPGSTSTKTVEVEVREGVTITRLEKEGRFRVRATRLAPPRKGTRLDVTLIAKPPYGPFDDFIKVTTDSPRQPTLLIPVMALVR